MFKQETWDTLSIMVNGASHYCTICSQLTELRIVLIPMSFAIFCPLNKHRRNKHKFGKDFKIPLFEVDINNNDISCNCYVKINKISWNKGKYLISIATCFRQTNVIRLQISRTLVFKCFKYADWKKSILCDYL